MMRGFKLVHVETKADDKSYTLIYRWEAKTAAAAGRVGEKSDGTATKPVNKNIKDKKTTIDDPN